MKKLEVNLGELMHIFDSSWEEMSHFLDLETGQVILIMDETRRALERIYEESYDPDGPKETFSIAQALSESDLRDWQKESVLEAHQVEAGYGTRYIRVPEGDSHQGYRDMERFIATVQDDELRDRLWRAISGRGAFRYFKDVLYDHRKEQKRWYEFQENLLRQRVLEWLESEGIEPIIEPQVEEPSPEEPSPRARLITEVLAFVRVASQLPGVTCIALIGSLTTDEPDPKDADLLVTVADDADLAPLAKQARKLQGHAQGFNRGADVFLADPQGNYLGRTCPWKRCGPGIRASCDALHCGQRPYLHDDLETIQLPADLTTAPPIELWPRVVARIAVPKDVEQELVAPLQEEIG